MAPRSPAPDAAALQLDWVMPVLAATVVATGAALVATDTLPGDETIPDTTNATEAEDVDDGDLAHDGTVNGTANATNTASDEAPDDDRNRTEANRTRAGNETRPENRTETPPEREETSLRLEERWRTDEAPANLSRLTVTDAAAGPEGDRVYAAGYGAASHATDGYDNGTNVAVLVALDADTGERRWTALTAGPDDGEARFFGLGAAGDGTVAAGGTTTRGNHTDLFAAEINATTGDVAWTATAETGNRSVHPSEATLTPTGSHVVVAGTDDRGYATAAFATDTGERAWLDVAGSTDDRAYSVAEGLAAGPAGERVYVTGRYVHDGDPARRTTGTVAYDVSDGTRLWTTSSRAAEDAFERGFDVTVGPTGNQVAVASVSHTTDGNADYRTIVYDAATGDERWSSVFASSVGGTDKPRSVAFGSEADTVYVTGTSPLDSRWDRNATTVAYAADNGTRRWLSSYDGGIEGTDRGAQLAPDPDGRGVLVTATSEGPPGGRDGDAAHLVLDPRTGATVDEHRYDASEANETNDAPRATVITPDGRHLVTFGTSVQTEDWSSRAFAVGYAIADDA